MNPYPAYKDSGVEWIGEVPEEWEIKRIKYIVVVNREALNERTDPDYEFYYVDIGNVSLGKISDSIEKIKFENAPSRARRIVKRGDTIVSTVRTYLKAITMVDLDEKNLIASTGFAVLSPKEIDRKYFSYLMTCERVIDTICAMSVGVSYPAVNAGDIANIPVWYPKDKAEQTAITAYLDRKTAQIDSLIERKRRLIELLQEERTAIISQAVTKGLNPAAKVKDSGVEWIGEVPEGWEVKRLKYLLAKIIDNRGRTPAFGGSGIPMLEVKQILDNAKYPSLEFEKYVEEDVVSDFVRSHLKPGDILIATVGATAGKTAIVPNDHNFFIAQNVVGFRTNKFCNSIFLYYILNAQYFQLSLNLINKSNTIDNLKVSVFINNYCVTPPLPEQTAIAAYLDEKTAQIDQTIARTERQIDLLQEYRTALISVVVTGKIDVRKEIAL